MSETSVPEEAGSAPSGAAPRNPGLQKLFEAAAAREARTVERSATPEPHPHSWLEADEAPRGRPAQPVDVEPPAPVFGPALQGRGPMTAGVVITLVALVAAAGVWLMVFGG
jgi:hypothetical protein